MGSSLSKKTIICSSPNALPDPLPNQTKTHTNPQLTDTKKPEEEPLLFIVVVFVEIDSPLLIITSRKGSRFQLSPLLIITTRKSFFTQIRTHSSMKVKDRVCSPSPHISNLLIEVRAFLQNAAGAFSLPPLVVK
ncbi:hypothetical protein TEA_011792 [Camellia sinensis var. sinensis]|uniref:Uncharacterized protein n=1 Tax=Camellia sinensis var. sinensis TaxID=542762 RepID=A0A4S4EE67_CAMSN|nr:hypothetical protein TEA_011792 [Camellia sinensis var. sinensis]